MINPLKWFASKNEDRNTVLSSAEQPAIWEVGKFFGIIVFVSFVFVALYAKSESLATFGLFSLWAAAFLAAGAAVGFLFGVPKVVQKRDSSPDSAKQDAPKPSNGYQQNVNTNLEEISDWLTKILVGLGLVNLRNLPPYVTRLVEFMVKDLNCTGTGVRGFALTVIIFYSVVGFLYGYLATRIYLQTVFAMADTSFARQAETAGLAFSNQQKLTFVAQKAEVQRELNQNPAAIPDVDQLVTEYNNIRNTQKASDTRTTAMARVLAKMSLKTSQNPQYVPEIDLKSEDGGRRLLAYAYLLEKPSADHLEPLVEALTNGEPTPFGQYWAIQALSKIISLPDHPSVSPAIRDRLAKLAESLKRSGGNDRYVELMKILKSL